MATRPIVPRGDGEGSLGTSAKKWGAVYTNEINGMDVENLGGVPVGYVSPFLQSTAPDGWLSCAGAEVSRTAYPDLWAFVNGSSQLISESDWQSKNTAGEKNIGWFSSGDGTTTFRLPRIVGSGELTETKRFTTAGSGSFVAPVTGIYKITLQGGGGGGAGGQSQTYGNRGGGGGGQGGHGEFYEKLIAGTSYAFTIGAGGSGGAAGGAGGDGGASSITINNNIYTSTGGAKGNNYSTASSGGVGGQFKINDTVIAGGLAGTAGFTTSASGTATALGGCGGGSRRTGDAGAGGAESFGSGGAGGGYNAQSSTANAGGAGGDGYIEFAFNPVPQFWYVRAFGSASNQGTIDITELANMLNDKLSISSVPLVAGYNGKQTFTSSGTFTAPVTGMYKITLQGAGGGGSGASRSSSYYGPRAGGGGGAGGHLEFYEKLTAGTTYSYIIGAGGAGSAGSTSTDVAQASNGGDSSIVIGANTYLCTGGGGAFGTDNICAGGVFGAGKINDITITRSAPGAAGGTDSSTGSNKAIIGGNGGCAVDGNGGYGSHNNGGNGTLGGGGAGGGSNITSVARNGGNGGDGYITFEWLDTSLL